MLMTHKGWCIVKHQTNKQSILQCKFIIDMDALCGWKFGDFGASWSKPTLFPSEVVEFQNSYVNWTYQAENGISIWLLDELWNT